jgi:hypothetical protein
VTNRIQTFTVAIARGVVAIGLCGATPVAAQDDELRAITARVHGTFEDAAGGLGVVSGDMTIARFELRNGAVTAIGRIDGAMADSTGSVLGRVSDDLAFAVADVASTCNQLRIELRAADAQVLQRPVHFDSEVAGFDSRDGATPKARPILCAAGSTFRGRPTADAVAHVLNDIVTALAAAAR